MKTATAMCVGVGLDAVVLYRWVKSLQLLDTHVIQSAPWYNIHWAIVAS